MNNEQRLMELKEQLKRFETAYWKVAGAIELLEDMIKKEKEEEKKDEVE